MRNPGEVLEVAQGGSRKSQHLLSTRFAPLLPGSLRLRQRQPMAASKKKNLSRDRQVRYEQHCTSAAKKRRQTRNALVSERSSVKLGPQPSLS